VKSLSGKRMKPVLVFEIVARYADWLFVHRKGTWGF
jgi:hypothetical protein